MEQEELQYEEVVDAGEGGEESFVGAAEDEHHLNDTDQSIETELEAIKGENQLCASLSSLSMLDDSIKIYVCMYVCVNFVD